MSIDATKLHFNDLQDFAITLLGTATAMEGIHTELGIDVWASIVPGQPIQITLDYVVPFAAAAVDHPVAAPISITIDDIPEVLQPIAPQPEPVPTPAADPAPMPVKTNWTPSEDRAAIEAYVGSILAGETIKAATEAAAYAAARPFEGTNFRLRNKLADQLAEALKIASEIPAPTVAEPSTAASGDNSSGEAADAPKQALPAAPDQADVHLPDAPGDMLGAHLASLPRKKDAGETGDGWPLSHDLDMARLIAGNSWGIQDIAVEFGIDSARVKSRWDALTGLHRDPKTDKLARRFTGAEVLARLEQMAAA